MKSITIIIIISSSSSNIMINQSYYVCADGVWRLRAGRPVRR